MTKALTDRVAWVTGGSSGIGAAIVETLVSEMDASVVVVDQNPPQADVAWVRCDLADRGARAQAIDELSASHGPADVLVHCAGVAHISDLVSTTDATWDRVFAVNLTAYFELLRSCIPRMTKNRWGRIVSISSGAAARATAGRSAYAASKAGLVTLTKVVARETAPFGVTANVVAPGLTATPMTEAAYGMDALKHMAMESELSNPMGAVIRPIDVARAVAFFCMPENDHITGQVLHVSAGSIMY